MKQQHDVAIVGAGGFTGFELLRLLSDHPHLNPVHITSDRYVGLPVAEIFPTLEGKCNLTFKEHSAGLPAGVPVLLATPNDTSLTRVPELLDSGHRVIDLSGVYRLSDRETFESSYRLEHTAFELVAEAVYGLPELFRSELCTARLVANPGCYATAAILPLLMLGRLRSQIAGVVIDAKSGVSGAGGRTEDSGFSFNGVYENFRAYRVMEHQHQPEIEEYATSDLEEPFPLTFIPHLLPLFRGILATIVINWQGDPPKELSEVLHKNIEGEPFIRLLDEPEQVELRRVQHTNFLDFSYRTKGRQTVIVSALDNLMKGAAGQALQNLNLMLDLPETCGLLSV